MRMTKLPLARSNAGVCALNGLIYCVGGWNGQVGIKQCDVFNPETSEWSSIAPLNTGNVLHLQIVYVLIHLTASLFIFSQADTRPE